jgi:hypothetical protein
VRGESDHWIVVRHRVRLAGHVTVADGGSARGGALTLTAARDGGQRRETLSSLDDARRRHACIRGDGLYYFLDLPEGNYELSGQDECGNGIEAKSVSISPAHASGQSRPLRLDLIASRDQAAGGRRATIKAGAEPTKRRHGR